MKLLFLALVGFATAQALVAARLEVSITPAFHGEALRLDSLRYETAAKETLAFTRVSFLLSEFALEREDGTYHELPESIGWFDSASQRETLLLDGIPEGKYRSIRFHLGPDPKRNKGDVAQWPADHPLNPNLNKLHWSWRTGYIFLALEGNYRGQTNEIMGYAYHFARDHNRVRVSLSAKMDLKHDGGLSLQFDMATLFHAPRPISFSKDGTTTHSDEGDPIAQALAANLPGAFRVLGFVSSASPLQLPSSVKPIDLPEKVTPYRFTMSRAFTIPPLPRDNPLIEERVALGRMLFHDPVLSRDGTISCATCHKAEAGFTDGLPVSVGIEGRKGDRNSMPLTNLAWKSEFFWDGRAKSLREQVLQPIADHREMDESLARVCHKLGASEEYARRFRAAYRSPEITEQKLALALEQFLLTLTACQSKFDRAVAGQEPFTEQEQRGFELFMTEREPRMGKQGADCFHCHGGPLFSDQDYHNNGLAKSEAGRAKATGRESDHGKFATPSLRNIALTAPYMHDGRFATLEEVMEHYSTGVERGPTLDPNLSKHPDAKLNLSPEEKAALIAFLRTLTDTPLP